MERDGVAPSNRSAIWLSFFSIGIAILALLTSAYQAYVYYGQLKTSEKQLMLSERQERDQLRAYLGTPNARISSFEEPNKYLISVNVKNYGQTPAHNLNISWASRNEWPRDDSLYNVAMDDQPATVGISVYPSSDVDWKNILYMDNNSIKDFRDGRRLLTFFGIVHYNDIFGTARISHFCYVFSKDDLDSFIKTKQEAIGTKCQNWNDGN